MQDYPLTPDDRDLERALRHLPPATDGPPLSPTAAAFSAGRRSARRQLRLWRTATAIALLLPLIPRQHTPNPHPDSPPLAVAPSAPQTGTPSFSPQTVWMLEASVTQHGLSGLNGVRLPDVLPVHPNDKI